MLQGLFINYYEAASVIIFGIGFSTLLISGNIIKKIIGFNFMDSAVYLYLASKGYIAGRVAPIVENINAPVEYERYINPIPAGLVLTGIVVSVAVSSFFLALAVRLYRAYGTLNLDEIVRTMQKETGVF